MKHYIVHHQTRIRKVGARNFLIRCDYNYTKKEVFEITDDAVRIISFLEETRTEKEILDAFATEKLPEEAILYLLEYLCENGYIECWEKKNTQFFSDIVKADFIPNQRFCSCTFEITPQCNFRCVHCYLGQHRELQQKLSTEDVKKIIDKLYDNGLLEIFLSGGEPLLRQDFKEIYLYAKKKGIQIELFTNGYLITDDIISMFKEYPPLELDISLYGASDETYKKITGVDKAFTKIISNIKKCLKNGITVSIKTPVFSLLKDDLQAIKDLSEELDIPYRNAFEMKPTVDDQDAPYQYQLAPKEAAMLKKKYSTTYLADLQTLKSNIKNPQAPAKGKRYLCSTGKCSGFIDYEGKMAPCSELRHRGISLLEHTFQEVWDHVSKISFERLRDLESDYKCMSCKLLVICKSCPALRERMNGSAAVVTERDCAFAEELYNVMKGDMENE